MPKLKTHRGAAKRFKKTGTGKFKRGHAFGAHILTSKSRKRKRRLKGTTLVSKADQKKLRTMLPSRVAMCDARGAVKKVSKERSCE
jgi:large subunit ribosomal protein L35